MAKIQDLDLPYLEFAEGAAPGTGASAITRIYAKADGLLYSKDDAGVETLVSGGAGGLGAWTTYTPTWTGSTTNPTLGNGTLTGRYKQLDSKTYAVIVNLTIGSTTTMGSGSWAFSLPSGLTSGALQQTIAGSILDSGTTNYPAIGLVPASSTTITNTLYPSGNVVTNGAPIAWADGDAITLSGILEIA